MVAVMLVAVLADRRALSLRTVAIAGTILLALRPESLLAPGFQMSFAATIALIAGFAALRDESIRRLVPRWAMPLFTLVMSSVIAGLATAPLAAAHFNRFTDYGLVANLLTVPAMGLLIMPGSVVAVLLWPIGLGGVGLWMMELGSRWILYIAHLIAGWHGAVTGVPAPGPLVLPLIALGMLWVILWQGRPRAWGAAPVLLGLALWSVTSRPPLLISADGALVGLMSAEGRAFSAPRGAGFAARSWLENDGDLGDQEAAAARPGFDGPKGARRFTLGDWTAIYLKGKYAERGLADACRSARLVIISVAIVDPPDTCRVIDATMLKDSGTLAIWLTDDGALRLQATETASRLWSGRRADPEPRLAAISMQ